MAVRPIPTVVQHGDQDWDGPYDDNSDITFQTPFPPAQYADIAALPSAALYDGCFAVVIAGPDSIGPCFVISNGSSWEVIPRRAAAQADSTAATVTDLKTDFNALLAKLRASGVMDT